MDIHRPVVFVAVVEISVRTPAAGAVDMHVLRNAFLQAGHGHQDLEGRPRRELSLDGLVHQRMIGVSDELVPVCAIDADCESVGIEAGTRDHSKDFTVTRVHGHDGTVAVAESQLRGVLQVFVDGQFQVLAGGGVLGTQEANLAAAAVDNDIARSVLAAQQLVDWLAGFGLHTPDMFAHSHGGTVANLATRRGQQFDRMVLMSWPVHGEWFPDFTKLRIVVDIRVNLDLVILADRGGQTYVPPAAFRSKVVSHINGWFNHSDTNTPAYWDKYGLPAAIKV